MQKGKKESFFYKKNYKFLKLVDVQIDAVLKKLKSCKKYKFSTS